VPKKRTSCCTVLSNTKEIGSCVEIIDGVPVVARKQTPSKMNMYVLSLMDMIRVVFFSS